MKIYQQPNIVKAMKVYEKTNRNTVGSTKSSEAVKDQLQLSENAKDFKIALGAFQKLPEVREEKVNEIRQRMQQGTYQITGKEVADKIIDSIYINQKI